MKQFMILIISFFFSSFQLMAQTDEGMLHYDINVESSQAGVSDMFEGSSMKVYFKGNLTRSEFAMGSMMSTTAIANVETMESILLMDSMMGKMALNLDQAQTEELQSMNEQEFEITETGETKDILGFTCKKATISMEGMSEPMTVWYTDDIEFKKGVNQQMNFEVNGAPLEFEMKNQGMTMSFKASNFEDTISDDSIFDLTIPEGYDVMDFDQYKQMLQGQGAPM